MGTSDHDDDPVAASPGVRGDPSRGPSLGDGHAQLAMLGELTASIGHELRNPLGVIASSVYLLTARLGAADEVVKKHLDRIGKQVAIANRIVSSVLDLVHDTPLPREDVALAPMIAEVIESSAPTRRTIVEGVFPIMKGHAMQMRQALVNLVENAAQATGDDGEIRVSGAVDGDAIEIAIADDGPGVDADAAKRLFQPLVTSKPGGVGLGLALVRRIVERHGGSIRYEPPASGGARFVVRLPLVE